MLVKCNNVYPKVSGVFLNYNDDRLPLYTIRLKYKQGAIPPFSTLPTAVLVDSTNNIWDWTYENNDWDGLLFFHTDLLEVINANTSNVTNMNRMFVGCSSLTTVSLFDTSNVTNMSSMFNSCPLLTSVPLFDTSKVADMSGMFNACDSLTSIPLFDTSKVTNMHDMFNGCVNVESGALALYQQAASQTTVPGHGRTFRNCGSNTETGAAELAQIPDDWK